MGKLRVKTGGRLGDVWEFKPRDRTNVFLRQDYVGTYFQKHNDNLYAIDVLDVGNGVESFRFTQSPRHGTMFTSKKQHANLGRAMKEAKSYADKFEHGLISRF